MQKGGNPTTMSQRVQSVLVRPTRRRPCRPQRRPDGRPDRPHAPCLQMGKATNALPKRPARVRHLSRGRCPDCEGGGAGASVEAKETALHELARFNLFRCRLPPRLPCGSDDSLVHEPARPFLDHQHRCGLCRCVCHPLGPHTPHPIVQCGAAPDLSQPPLLCKLLPQPPAVP